MSDFYDLRRQGLVSGIQWQTAKALEGMGGDARPAEDALVKLFATRWKEYDPDEGNPGYQAPLEALVAVRSPKALQVVRDFRAKTEKRLLAQNKLLAQRGAAALDEDKPGVRVTAVDDKKLHPSARTDQRPLYAYDLSLLKDEAVPAIATLGTLLGDRYLTAHRAGVDALARIDHPDAAAALDAYLKKAMKALKKAKAACTAAQYVGALGRRADPAAPAIAALLSKAKSEARPCLVETLTRIGTPKALAVVSGSP
jgi:hypothetical protein